MSAAAVLRHKVHLFRAVTSDPHVSILFDGSVYRCTRMVAGHHHMTPVEVLSGNHQLAIEAEAFLRQVNAAHEPPIIISQMQGLPDQAYHIPTGLILAVSAHVNRPEPPFFPTWLTVPLTVIGALTLAVFVFSRPPSSAAATPTTPN